MVDLDVVAQPGEEFLGGGISYFLEEISYTRILCQVIKYKHKNNLFSLKT